MKLGKTLVLVMASVILLASCGGKEPLSESISVQTDTLKVGYALRSYQLSVKANCSWTVKMDAETAFWVSMPSGGKGDADISVRVMKNAYKNGRKGVVELVTPSGKKSSFVISQAGDPTKEEEVSANLRLGTYNLRLQVSDELEINKWANRKTRLFESIKDNDFDVFGVQEVSSTMQSNLKTQFGNTYDFFFFSPYAQNGTGDKAQGIIYKKSLFDISDKKFFWMATTLSAMDTMAENDVSTEGKFKRGGCCCVLTHKQTGIKLFFMNLHGCLSKDANTNYAPMIIEMEKGQNKNSYPSFFVGDLNSRPDYPASVTYKTHWKDSFLEAGSEKRTGVELSYNGFSSINGKYRLDYVYYICPADKFVLKNYNCSNKLYSGQYASDHFPVYIDVKIIK